MKKLLSLLICAAMVAAGSVTAGAAETGIVPSGARIEAGLVAADYVETGSVLEPEGELPSYYSSLDLGYTTPVRSQSYNTCWAYSSSAVCEALAAKQGLGAVPISVMSMNYWATTHEDGTGWQRGYASAGYPYISIGYIISKGAIKEEDFPDTMTYEDYTATADELEPYYYADSIINLNGKDTQTVKTAIYNCGAAVGNFHYDANMLNSETYAYYCDVETIATANLYGHSVAIVGWDDSYSAENFLEAHRPENDGAWLCKNSWGAYWGNGGYFWISYEDKHLFDQRFGPSYTVSGITPNTPRTDLKQNEEYGATYEFDYLLKLDSEIGEMTYANVLDFSDGFNIIDKVVFESCSEGAEYEIYYIPADKNGVPLSDSRLWTLLATGVIDYTGYYGVDVGGFEAPLSKGAIGVKIIKGEDGADVAIGVGEWLSAGSKSVFVPESKHGMSYLMGYSSQPVDIMDFYDSVLNDSIGGTLVIKALTHTDRLTGDVDGDGKVTILDGTHIQRYLADIEEFDKVQKAVADYDGDGMITIIDCTAIQLMLAGIAA